MPPNMRWCDPFTRNRESGGMGSKGRNGRHILNFDNWMSIQVR